MKIIFDDKVPDGFGRRRFTLEWEHDGPAGTPLPNGRFRRAQCFHARPQCYGFDNSSNPCPKEEN